MEDYFMISKERRFYVDIMAVHPEVTGSCNLIIVKQPDNSTVKFVVDCGLFQERQYSKNNEVLPFNPANIEWAVGGLNYLVKNGQINDISDETLGTHPRTCVGFNADNSEMILLTIDGRNKNYVA